MRVQGLPQVFAVPPGLRDGSAVRAGQALASTLADTLLDRPVRRHRQTADPQPAVDCGNGRALVYRGGLLLEGRLASWLKRRAERRLLASLQKPLRGR
jgi:hypothetical protein